MSAPDPDEPYSGRYEAGVHLLPARVYYEDTDFTGVVYHANYLRFFERGRSEFLRYMGPPEPGRDDPGAFAVTRIEIDFRAPARIHDALLIRTGFEGLKGPRMVFDQQIVRGERLLCAAKVIAVPIKDDGSIRRPTPAEIAHWNRYGMPGPT
jgi:acyl-CoA thioester hydrolase